MNQGFVFQVVVMGHWVWVYGLQDIRIENILVYSAYEFSFGMCCHPQVQQLQSLQIFRTYYIIYIIIIQFAPLTEKVVWSAPPGK